MIMCKSGSLDILHCETIQVVTKSYLSASPDECVVHASIHAWVPDTHCVLQMSLWVIHSWMGSWYWTFHCVDSYQLPGYQ